MKAIAQSVLGLVVTLLASQALAHKSPAARRLMLQLDGQGIVAVVELSLGGAEAQVLAATFDTDRNGSFSDGEREALASALVVKGMRGLSFQWGDEALSIARVTPRLAEESLGSSKLVAVGLVELAKPANGDATTDLSVTVEKDQGPLSFMIQALDNYRVLASPGMKLAADGRGFRDAARILPGESLRVRITRLGTPKL